MAVGIDASSNKTQDSKRATPLLEWVLGRRCWCCDTHSVVLHVSENQEGSTVPVITETGVKFVAMSSGSSNERLVLHVSEIQGENILQVSQ